MMIAYPYILSNVSFSGVYTYPLSRVTKTETFGNVAADNIFSFPFRGRMRVNITTDDELLFFSFVVGGANQIKGQINPPNLPPTYTIAVTTNVTSYTVSGNTFRIFQTSSNQPVDNEWVITFTPTEMSVLLDVNSLWGTVVTVTVNREFM